MDNLKKQSIDNTIFTKNKRKYFLFRIIDEHLIWLLVILAIIILSIISPKFFNTQNFLNILMNSTVLGILVIAESFCLLVGKFDLSIESTLGFSALIGALLVSKYNMNSFLAIIIVLAIGAAIGLVNGVFIVKIGVNPFLQTLSMLIILRGLMFFITKGVTIFPLPDSYRVLGHTEVLNIPTPVIILIFLYIFFIILTERRPWGRKLYAAGANPIAAFASGLKISRINIMVFVISGLLAAFSGLILSTRLGAVDNKLGEGMVFIVFAAAVIGGISLKGGKGKFIGALGGVIFIGIVESILSWFNVNVFMVETIRGVIILFAVFLDAIKNKVREVFV